MAKQNIMRKCRSNRGRIRNICFQLQLVGQWWKKRLKKRKKYVENLIANGHQISHHQSMLHGVVGHRIVQIFILEYIFIDISSTTLSAFRLTFSWSPIWFSFPFGRIDALVAKLIRAFILCAKGHWRTSIGLESDGGQGLLSTYKLQAYGICRMYNELFY